MNDNHQFDDRSKRRLAVRMQVPGAISWTVCWAIAVALGLKISVVWLGVAIIPMLGAPAWIAIANWSSLSQQDREDYGHAWRWGSSGAALLIAPLALAAYVMPLEVWLTETAPADLLVAGALILLFLQIVGFRTILLQARSRQTPTDNLS